MMLRRLIPILPILAAPTAMLYPLWSNPVSAGEDDVIFYYPLRKLAGQAMARGEWPMTYAQEATGGPLMADPQAGVLHPATWLFAAVDPHLAYSLSIFIAFSTAGLGMWLYLRRVGLIRVAAAFGAAVFMFCGFLVGHRVHLSMLQTAAMLPWMLYGLELLRRQVAWRPSSAAMFRPDTTRKRGQSPFSNGGKGDSPHFRFLAFVVLIPSIFLAIAAGSWPTLIHIALICLAYFLLRVRPLLRSLGVATAAAAMAALLALPQILATAALLSQATRQKLGFATFGENSFFPAASVLAFFPFLMGNRSPNLFAQPWWGPWHLCEMLGYVGLATLALAGAAVWRLYRKRGLNPFASSAKGVCTRFLHQKGEDGIQSPPNDGGYSPRLRDHVSLTRVWVWIALGAGVFMLGYYLPTYRLVHWVPILNVVRCPARMVLAVDFALTTLAALAVHYAMGGSVVANAATTAPAPAPAPDFSCAFRRTIVRSVTIVLPVAMLTMLAVAAVMAFCHVDPTVWKYFFTGTQEDAKTALGFGNLAVWVPLGVMVLTVLIVRLWARRPKLWPALVGLVLLDLFFVARFVDVPAAGTRPQDPEASPAAAWLRKNAPEVGDYRVFSIGTGYYQRASELLMPKACHSMGFSSLGSYGPFENPRHAQLLGLSITGYSRDWAGLLRRNYLLSLFNVRYILAADPLVREVLESVRIPEGPPPAEGPNLLAGGMGVSPLVLAEVGEGKMPSRRGGETSMPPSATRGQDALATGFTLDNATASDGVLRFQTPFMWRVSSATQAVEMKADTVYRIRLDARGPEGGAANFLRAEVLAAVDGDWDHAGLSIRQDEIGLDWRHFEWAFRTRPDCTGSRKFMLQSISERPIYARNVQLCESRLDLPVDPGGLLKPGEKVYRFCVEMPPLNPADRPVFIYENLLAASDAGVRAGKFSDAEEAKYIEWLKWDYPRGDLSVPHALPAVAFEVPNRYETALMRFTLPGAAAYMFVAALCLFRSRRRAKS